MVDVSQFDPLEVGEIDTFAFDLTRRTFGVPVVAAQWRAFMTPFSAGVDINPQAMINNVSIGTSATVSGNQEIGQFTFAQVGPPPASAAGGTYVLAFKAFLANGNQIQGSAYLPCVLPGQY